MSEEKLPNTRWYKDIWRIINSAKRSTGRATDGSMMLRDGMHFKGMTLDTTRKIAEIMDEHQMQVVKEVTGSAIVSPEDVRKQSRAAMAPLTSYSMKGLSAGDASRLISRVADSMFGGPIGNPGYNIGSMPNFGGMVMPNLWIDPASAASIYAAGGLPTFTINKKAKSIRSNGIRIKNPRIEPSRMEEVNEVVERNGLAKALADATRDGLTYGGAILFPFFKHDMPVTLLMDIASLAKYDVVEKGCIERYVVLDRNNAIHIPSWNPTADDFLNPKFYFIPYLGSDVMGQRCARIVPIPQAGYWGTIMTMGWGVSDIQGWYQAACDYEGVASAIPTMIRQMSLLVHTYNMDLTNAMGGAVTLRDFESENTIAIHEASNENPINMDVVGTIDAIKRDFTAVAELSRITRQHFAMRANMPEELIWSSDRGAFSSGDQTDGLLERQWEGIQFSRNEVADRCKNIAMLEVINALGKDRDIIKALPYTSIEFLSPKITSAEKRGQLVTDLCEGLFNLVASGVPLSEALKIVLPYGDDHLAPPSEVIEKVEEHQREVEAREKEDHDLDTQLKQKQIEAPVATPGIPGASSSSASSDKKSGYTKMEQRQHEKTRGGSARREGKQRAEGKKL